MSMPGGLPAPRPDQGYAPTGAPMAPGAQNGIVRAREVIVSGASGGVFVYAGAAALGNLIASVAGAAGTDPQDNAYLQGTASYLSGTTAISINGAALDWWTAPGPGGPWTFFGSFTISAGSPGALGINFSSIFGAINVPQASGISDLPLTLPPPSTYSVLYTGEMAAAINDIYQALITAAVIT